MRRRTAGRAPAVASSLPDVNSTVVLQLRQGPPLPTRVEDHDDGLLFVAAVDHPGDHGSAAEGLLVTVGWAVPRGACSVGCELVRVVPGQPSLWGLRALGPVQRSQRRRFVRGRLLGSVELDPAALGTVVLSGAGPVAGAEPPGHVGGSLVDLGEGGAQVRTGAGAGAFRQGDAVRLMVVFGDHRVELMAEVVRDLADARGGRLLALAFDTDEATADAIRSEVLRAQIAGRAKELGTW